MEMHYCIQKSTLHPVLQGAQEVVAGLNWLLHPRHVRAIPPLSRLRCHMHCINMTVARLHCQSLLPWRKLTVAFVVRAGSESLPVTNGAMAKCSVLKPLLRLTQCNIAATDSSPASSQRQILGGYMRCTAGSS